MNIQLSDLRNKIDQSFTLDEIKSICFDLEIDFDNLEGEVKRSRIESLIVQVENNARNKQLLTILKSRRPHVNWDNRPPQEMPSPYRGLFPFEEKDADIFFGRQKFITHINNAVENQNIVAVIGPSGSGKSSVINAGLIPYLRQNGTWLILHIRPGKEPFQNLAGALVPLLEPEMSKVRSLEEVNYIAEALKEKKMTLAQICDRLIQEQDSGTRLLLFIDQFEELYTLSPEQETQLPFLDQILSTADDQNNQAKLIFSLRADFLSQALTYRPFADALQNAGVMLGPMNREELRQAIELPIVGSGVSFEPGLVERILDDVGLEPGNLPLLQFAITLLWDRQVRGRLTHQAYKEIGRVEGALARYADEKYNNLKPDEKKQARRLFVQLVQPGGGTEDTRRLATLTELGEINWEIVRRLANARLVVTNQSPGPIKEETVEVAHEALISDWGRLRNWMKEDRAFRSWQEQLRISLGKWIDDPQDSGTLIRGGLLEEANSWLIRRQEDLSKPEYQFIMASLASRRRNQQLRRVLVVVSVIVAFSMAYFAYQSKISAASANYNLAQANFAQATAEANQVSADNARSTAVALGDDLQSTLNEVYGMLLNGVKGSDKLASDTLAAMAENGNNHLVILLAIEADGIEESFETHQALRIAMSSTGYDENLRLSRLTQAMWHPLVNQILTINERGQALVWDLNQNSLSISYVINQQDLEKASWNSDGSQILTIDSSGKSTIWDVESKDVIVEIELGAYQAINSFAHDNGFYILTKVENGHYQLSNETLTYTRTFTATEFITDTVNAQIGNQLTLNPKENQLFLPNFGTEEKEPEQRPPGDYFSQVCDGSPDQNRSSILLNQAQSQVMAIEYGRVIVWDIDTEKKLFDFENPSLDFVDASWSPDERFIYAIDIGGNLSVIDTAQPKGKRFVGNSAHEGIEPFPVQKVLWNNNGNILYTIGCPNQNNDPYVQVFEEGEIPNSLPYGKPVTNLSFDPDETRVLTIGIVEMVVWDDNGSQLFNLAAPRPILEATWNHDGSLILAFTSNGTLQINRVYVSDLVEFICDDLQDETVEAGREYLNNNSWEPNCVEDIDLQE